MSLPAHDAQPLAAVPEVSHDELVRLLATGGVVLVDVLPEDSFLSGHLPGARSLPLDEIPRRAAEQLPDRGAPVVAYCGGFT